QKEKEINANLRHLSMTRVSVAHRPEITNGADMILHLAAATAPLQVEVTSRRRAAAPVGADGAKSVETAPGHDECSGDARKGDSTKNVGKDNHSRAGKDDPLNHGWE